MDAYFVFSAFKLPVKILDLFKLFLKEINLIYITSIPMCLSSYETKEISWKEHFKF